MLGILLDKLTVEEENRVLTQTLHPWAGDEPSANGGCLMERIAGSNCEGNTAFGRKFALTVHWDREQQDKSHSFQWRAESTRVPQGWGSQYDALCERFGINRVNDLIRNRILENRTRKALDVAQEAVVA
jgi:hypothetical protein